MTKLSTELKFLRRQGWTLSLDNSVGSYSCMLVHKNYNTMTCTSVRDFESKSHLFVATYYHSSIKSAITAIIKKVRKVIKQDVPIKKQKTDQSVSVSSGVIKMRQHPQDNPAEKRYSPGGIHAVLDDLFGGLEEFKEHSKPPVNNRETRAISVKKRQKA